MEFPLVKHISETFIKPKYEVSESKHPYHLSPLDLIFLSAHYNQKGLLYKKPINQNFSIENHLESLKQSLSLTLVHFYPLAGQLETVVDKEKHRMLLLVDCHKGHGVRFVHARVHKPMSYITSSSHVPEGVKSFFDLSNLEVNYDGHNRPLLSIQVTELVDGIFIGCSMNHVLVDGTSFWHFWNIWSEIHRADGKPIHISRPPLHKRWIPDGYSTDDVFLPFTNPDEFIHRYRPPQLQERYFHFSSEMVVKLKSRANAEISSNSNIQVSSFQALTAFIWKSIVRAKGLKPDKLTHCKLAANTRTRLEPPLPEEYFGNALAVLKATCTVAELFDQNLGYTALLLHESVVKLTNKVVHDFVKSWFKSPFVYKFDELVNIDADSTVQVGSSPRFNIYGNEFAGLGKPVAVRSGYANKFGGKVIVFPGYEGGGSVDAEICLPCESMKALESDEEFMAIASVT